MDTSRNEFVEREANAGPDARYIPFAVGELLILKGYRFKVADVELGSARMTVEGLGKAAPREATRTHRKALKRQLRRLGGR